MRNRAIYLIIGEIIWQKTYGSLADCTKKSCIKINHTGFLSVANDRYIICDQRYLCFQPSLSNIALVQKLLQKLPP